MNIDLKSISISEMAFQGVSSILGSTLCFKVEEQTKENDVKNKNDFKTDVTERTHCFSIVLSVPSPIIARTDQNKFNFLMDVGYTGKPLRYTTPRLNVGQRQTNQSDKDHGDQKLKNCVRKDLFWGPKKHIWAASLYYRNSDLTHSRLLALPLQLDATRQRPQHPSWWPLEDKFRQGLARSCPWTPSRIPKSRFWCFQ